MGGNISTGKDNDELVDNLIEAEFLKTPSLQQVFRDVDRGHYYSKEHKINAYRDAAWRNGNLHLSAPCVYSEVMEALQLERGLSFLNLGSGSGYLSTMAGLILGPYGINHGVEIFSEIVDFAYLKLDEFLKIAEAVNMYQFCEPSFFVGNCLRLDSSCSLYDRVYCGAGCPEEHEMYFRQLLKIGGILVVPLNNKLMQIKRTSESTWESTKVLSVSFAALIRPLEQEPLTFVKLPGFSPPSLQDICRYKVRKVLKHRIDTDHPNLQEKRKRRSKPRMRHVRRIVIPFMHETDTDSFDSMSHSDENHDSGDEPFDPLIESRATAIIQTLIRTKVILPNDSAGPSTSSENGAISENSTSSKEASSSAKKASSKSETSPPGDDSNEDDGCKCDSDSSDDDKSLCSDSELFGNASMDMFVVKSKVEHVQSSTQGYRKRRRHHSVTEQPSHKVRCQASEPGMRIKKTVLPRKVTWKRFSKKTVESPESPKSSPDSKAMEQEPKEEEESYSSLMASSIMTLPLPLPIRQYVNYMRNNV